MISLVKCCSYRLVGLPWWLSGKESACNSGDLYWISESGRFPGEGSGNPLLEPGGLQSMELQDLDTT